MLFRQQKIRSDLAFRTKVSNANTRWSIVQCSIVTETGAGSRKMKTLAQFTFPLLPPALMAMHWPIYKHPFIVCHRVRRKINRYIYYIYIYTIYDRIVYNEIKRIYDIWFFFHKPICYPLLVIIKKACGISP